MIDLKYLFDTKSLFVFDDKQAFVYNFVEM
jgi:hypothetical protein